MRSAILMTVLCILIQLLINSEFVNGFTIEDCTPKRGTRAFDCNKKMTYCLHNHQIGLKWAGKGCKRPGNIIIQDAGCQCEEYCGYTCAASCNRDPVCQWRAAGCTNIRLNKTHAEMNLGSPCPVRSATTKPPTNPPSSSTPPPSPGPGDDAAFNIQIWTEPNTPEIDRDITRALEAARAKWTTVITKGFPSTVQIDAGEYCNSIPLASIKFGSDKSVDDLLIAVKVADIDGENGVWARAGVCIQDTSGRPRLAVMILDRPDIEILKLDDLLQTTITHEMGHCLGLGTLWEQYKLVEMPKTPQYKPPASARGWKYLGKEGNAAHYEITGFKANAKVEDMYGGGTARKHWKDLVYPGELMTGRVYDSRAALSKLSVRALRDLGYSTNAAKADPYDRRQPKAKPKKKKKRALQGAAADSEAEDEDELGQKIGEEVLEFPLVQLEESAKPGREAEFKAQKVAFQQRMATISEPEEDV